MENSLGVVIGTAGAAGAGKTALVRALTGTDPDRLPEEKRRGTTRLGFARMELADGRHASIVDVPGATHLLREAAKGFSGVDIAVMAVAADWEIPEQTLHHLALLESFQVPACVFAITRCDAADPAPVEKAVRRIAEGGPYEYAQIVRTCAPTGRGIEDLARAVAETADSIRPKRPPFVRYAIDRAFSTNGSNTIVTGTLTSGSISAGDKLVAQPEGRSLTVASIQEHGMSLECAHAGNRVALGFSNTGCAHAGDFLREPGHDALYSGFDALFLATRDALHTFPLVNGQVRLLYGTREVSARVHLSSPCEAGGSALGHVQLLEPLPLSPGDTAALCTFAPIVPVAGMRVLLCGTDARKFAARMPLLEAIADDDLDAAVEYLLALQREPISAERISRILGMPQERANAALEGAREAGVAVRFESWHRLWASSHEDYPSARSKAYAQLEADGPAGATPTRLARETGLPQALAQGLLQDLSRSGDAVALSAGLYLSKTAFKTCVMAVRGVLEKGPATTSQLKQAMGAPRSVAIPVLEHLDAAGVTMREGDMRRLI